jgi:hypothetical protein
VMFLPDRLFLCVCLCVCVCRTVPACSFYSLKEVQGYKTLGMWVILVEEAARRPREALSDGVVVCTVEAWRWYSWYYFYMVWQACHC